MSSQSSVAGTPYTKHPPNIIERSPLVANSHGSNSTSKPFYATGYHSDARAKAATMMSKGQNIGKGY